MKGLIKPGIYIEMLYVRKDYYFMQKINCMLSKVKKHL